MNFSVQRKIFFTLCLFIFVSLGAFAQQNYFIYLQTENNQLFYVKLNGKVISSSSAGYLIIPNLPNGALQLSVGFPKNEFPEEKFDLNVDNKNEGFLLKNLGDQGWVLFNLQSLVVVGKSSINIPIPVIQNSKNEDAFSTLLANAVNDSSLLQKDNNIENQQKPKDANQIVSNDSLTNNNPNTGVVAGVQPENSMDKLIRNDSKNNLDSLQLNLQDNSRIDTLRISDTVFVKNQEEVNKILGATETTGMDMIYTIKKPLGEDTVRIHLPIVDINKENLGDSLPNKNNHRNANDSGLTITPTIIPSDYKATEQLPAIDSNTNLAVKPSIVKLDSLDENKDFIEPVKETKNEARLPEKIKENPRPKDEIIVLPQVLTSSEVNSDCTSFATDQDFLKVRKKMASSIGMESMIEAARKFFKIKCYSTEQIKNLSYLFLSDEGKYLFFDMAYAFTSDSNLYETLQSQFEDSYYLNRFKAMIRK